MRKLNLENFNVYMRDPKGDKRLVEYQFRDNLVSILIHPKSNLNGPEAYEFCPVAKKIRDADKEEVLLYEREYKEILDVLKRFRGFTSNDIDFLERIYNCPVIPEKDSKGNIIEFSDN